MSRSGNQSESGSGCGYSVPLSIMERILEGSKNAVGLLCTSPRHSLSDETASSPPPTQHLKAPQKQHGIISLFELTQNVFGLITTHQLLPRTDPSCICGGTEISFDGFGHIELHPDDVYCVTTSEELDATVIELREHVVSVLKLRGAEFVRIASARVGDQVAMVHNTNRVFSIDKGFVYEVSESRVCYQMSPEVWSSGAPILLWDFQAIGLHSHWENNSADSVSGPFRIATHLPDVVAFHLISRIAPYM